MTGYPIEHLKGIGTQFRGRIVHLAEDRAGRPEDVLFPPMEDNGHLLPSRSRALLRANRAESGYDASEVCRLYVRFLG